MPRLLPPKPIVLASAALLASMLVAAAGCAGGARPRATLADAEARLVAGDTAGAADGFIAAARGSDDPALLGRAAAVAAAVGRGPESRAFVERWAVLRPDDPAAHARLATLAFEARELERTAAALARVHALAGANAAAGLLLERRPAARVARVMALHAAAFPDEKLAHFALAEAARAADDLATAAAAAGRARALDPEWLDALVLEARIRVARERDPAVLAALDARAAAPDARAALRTIAALLRAEAGDAVGARAALAREVAREPDSVEARLAFAEVAAQAGDVEAAARVLQPAMLEASRDDVRFELGRLAERQGADAEALSWYREIADPRWTPAAMAALARLVAKGEGLPAARAFLAEARRDAPAEAGVLWRAEAQLLRVHGDLPGALAALDEALAGDDDAELRYLKALLLVEAGETRAGVRALRALLVATPDDPRLLNALGYTLADAGRDLGEAERLLAAAIAAAPDDAATVDSWGWLKFRQGDLAEARRQLERAWRLAPTAESGAHLGEVLWAQGEREAARRAWDAAATIDADDRVLKMTRARLDR